MKRHLSASAPKDASRLHDLSKAFSLLAMLLLFCQAQVGTAVQAGKKDPVPGISKAASKSCAAKVKRLEDFAKRPASKSAQATQFTEDEINSYLALDLSSRFSPGLQTLVMKLEEGALQGNAVLDFDRMGINSTQATARLLTSMLSGIHQLMARGKLISLDGKGSFQLEEAQFDGTRLPKFLVEEIITAVGRKQRPPFDPMTPSEMIYRIQRLDLHQGYIVVYQ